MTVYLTPKNHGHWPKLLFEFPAVLRRRLLVQGNPGLDKWQWALNDLL